MPELSRFFGIIIRIHSLDHPPPHFHAIYGEFEAQFEIATLEVREGHLPTRAYGRVIEWASIYEDELMKAWDAASAGTLPEPIPPLTRR